MPKDVKLSTFTSPFLESAHFWTVMVTGVITLPIQIGISRAIWGPFVPGATFGQEFQRRIIRMSHENFSMQQLRWSIPGAMLHDMFLKDPENAKLYEQEKLTIAGRDVVLHSVGDKLVSFKDADIVVIYVHGGGFNIASTSGYLALFKAVSNAALAPNGKLKSVKFIGIDYTLSPGAHFPVARDEIAHVYKEHVIGKLCVNPEKVVMAGDSAGPNIIFSSLFALKKSSPETPLPGSIIALSPWFDTYLPNLSKRPSWIENQVHDVFTYDVLDQAASNYIGPTSDPAALLQNHEVSPVYAKPSDFGSSWPMTQIWYGDKEVFADEAKVVLATLKTAGTEVEEVIGENKVHIYAVHQIDTDPSIAKKMAEWLEKTAAKASL
ncbi:alpha/beta-hydrolase [Gonapodya prolifera JEL478]|uniref:Alpha/beta-hydrolase n=1 Tax=Gonapodya prolifera (strain JEL478) TaxID=1344416 RepID=A0A139A7R9_GONPJ|nr:alpha/beta-hydrolase [Gonapodya prolifera JEL478]|eukprot:KXS12807.1 alpha/beta-hydrolase [Gonapodya prolifera JEL478]